MPVKKDKKEEAPKKRRRIPSPSVTGGRTVNRFIKAGKEVTPEIEQTAQEFETYAALDALAISPGGQILVDNLVKDCIGTIDWLAVRGLSDPESEVRAKCADLKSKLELIRSLTRAKNNKDVLEVEITDALKE